MVVVSFVLEVYYMVRYVDDGLLSLKLEQDLEHVETPEDGRLLYLIGDTVLTEWEDEERYEAQVVDVGRKLTSCF